MAKEITIIHCFSDKKVCEIPIPCTKDNKDVVATVVVPLICWETNADSIKLELQTRGKNQEENINHQNYSSSRFCLHG